MQDGTRYGLLSPLARQVRLRGDRLTGDGSSGFSPRARLARRRRSLSVAMGKKDETPEERAARKEKEKKGTRSPDGSRLARRRP